MKCSRHSIQTCMASLGMGWAQHTQYERDYTSQVRAGWAAHSPCTPGHLEPRRANTPGAVDLHAAAPGFRDPGTLLAVHCVVVSADALGLAVPAQDRSAVACTARRIRRGVGGSGASWQQLHGEPMACLTCIEHLGVWWPSPAQGWSRLDRCGRRPFACH